MAKTPPYQQIIKLGLLTLILSALWSCSFLGDRKKGEYIPVEFDLNQSVGPFNGLGANVPLSFYSRRMKVLQTFNELGIKYVRVKRSDENWDDILALRASISRLGIKWIYSLDEVPIDFLDNYGRLIDIDGFAIWWAEEVDELLYQDVPADYIELLDMPDMLRGDSAAFDSDIFNQLIHATRNELDMRDFQNVSIVGPSLSSAGFGGKLETWYMDLDQAGFDMLPVWSVHLSNTQQEGENVGVTLQDFVGYLEGIESVKPLFINAYAPPETNFNGIQYPDPAKYDVLGNQNTFETYYYSATFTLPYALRMYSNTLELLKFKDAIPFLYQIYDAPADVKYKKQSWGLLDLNGGEKPVFTLLANLIKEIPKRSTIHSTLEPLPVGMNALAFVNQDEWVVTAVNEGLKSKAIQVRLKGAPRKLAVKHAAIHYASELLPPELGRKDILAEEVLELKRAHNTNDGYVFSVTLPPQCTFVGEFQRP